MSRHRNGRNADIGAKRYRLRPSACGMPAPRDLNPTGHPPVALVASAATAEDSEAKREGGHLGHTNQSDQRPRQPSPGGAIHPATLLVGALDGTAALLRVGTGAAVWRASPRREVGTLAHLL